METLLTGIWRENKDGAVAAAKGKGRTVKTCVVGKEVAGLLIEREKINGPSSRPLVHITRHFKALVSTIFAGNIAAGGASSTFGRVMSWQTYNATLSSRSIILIHCPYHTCAWPPVVRGIMPVTEEGCSETGRDEHRYSVVHLTQENETLQVEMSIYCRLASGFPRCDPPDLARPSVHRSLHRERHIGGLDVPCPGASHLRHSATDNPEKPQVVVPRVSK